MVNLESRADKSRVKGIVTVPHGDFGSIRTHKK